MTVTPQTSGNGLSVTYEGAVYPAEEIARGAAYELSSAAEAPGFEWSRPGTTRPWRRFVHATEVSDVHPATEPVEEPEAPLLVPLHRERGWSYVQQLSQQPTAAGDPTLAAVRDSAVIRRGTRMVKVLSARQLAGYVRGWLPHGFCYREHDVAHLRTPAATTVLRTDGSDARDGADVTYALRWRAADPGDYDVPVGAAHRGLTALAPRDRIGAAVLGTGFVPSSGQLVPEFVTRDFADLPMPANATLLAYPADGVEVVLYSYQAEQRGWLRMAGPQWRHLLAAVPGLSPDQEYVPTGEAPRSTRLVGGYAGGDYEAVADLPGGFRVLAMTRAARYPVEWAARRLRLANWRGAPCLVLREETGWLRLRLRRPDPDAVAETGAQCQERGVYEAWAPAAEVTEDRVVDLPYRL
ncbi:hypothetical protein AB0L34_29160 [Micromonospora sp. NPDC052213]|uniref:hypothetical protein n=1 Tax=Micromonospora sp. NPDC052213 TaxID=3155812 RepID=UPI00342C9AB9